MSSRTGLVGIQGYHQHYKCLPVSRLPRFPKEVTKPDGNDDISEGRKCES